MKDVYVIRDLFYDGKASLGTCFVFDDKSQLFKSESLERGWMDNQTNVSCIPEGVYSLELEYSAKFNKDLWEIKGVPNRSECKFHAANYWRQLNGCIALGKNRKDIDDDFIMDVTSSKDTMKLFHSALDGDKFANLHIRNVLNI